jgi:hypothetical protein
MFHCLYYNHPYLINRMITFRCATGESWQAVMLACKSGAECHISRIHPYGTNLTTASPHISTGHTKGSNSNLPKCGSDFAYLYFCSFVFLSSFLVSRVEQKEMR